MKKKLSIITLVLTLTLMFGLNANIGNTNKIGYAVYKATDSELAGGAVGAAAGGALAYTGGEVGAATGMALGGGPVGAAAGALVGFL